MCPFLMFPFMIFISRVYKFDPKITITPSASPKSISKTWGNITSGKDIFPFFKYRYINFFHNEIYNTILGLFCYSKEKLAEE